MSGTWATGWATNDIVTAAEFAKGVASIGDTILGSDTASITFSSILGTYAHLRLVVVARDDQAVAQEAFYLRFNGDSTAIYDSFTSVSAVFLTAGTRGTAGHAAGASATAGAMGVFEILIPYYAGTANQKGWQATGSVSPTDGSTASYINAQCNGKWRSTAAITSITLLPTAGNFKTGTRASLYAMGF